MVAGDKELAEAIKFITVDRELYETDMRLRQELDIHRILMGLDVQPQDVKGMGRLQPLVSVVVLMMSGASTCSRKLDTFGGAATRMILHAEMQKAGLFARHDPEHDALVRPDRSKREDEPRRGRPPAPRPAGSSAPRRLVA